MMFPFSISVPFCSHSFPVAPKLSHVLVSSGTDVNTDHLITVNIAEHLFTMATGGQRVM